MKTKVVTKRPRYTRPMMTLLVVTMLALLQGCVPQIDTSFHGGIRVETYESIITTFGISLAPIPAVPNRGRLITRRSNLSTGTRSVFQGLTNAVGISDYPDAITDSQWSVGVGPSAAPPCLENAFMEDVPLQGGQFIYFCHL